MSKENKKTIERKHNFENKINLIIRGKKYFTVRSEKNNKFYIIINEKTLNAFQSENWRFFERAEKLIIDEFCIDNIEHFGKTRKSELLRCAKVITEKI